MNTPSLATLLTYRRPARSKTEALFIRRYIDTIPGIIADNYGNRILACEGATTMISCHTDTVHRTPGMQKIVTKNGIISLSPREKVSNCLGADDSAGVYAALRMIAAGVKATFIFHRDEEIGGKGSTWLASNYPAWLRTFDRCIALDRRGTQDVITHQAWGRCCSDEFAIALAAALDMGHLPSDAGIFTDSANYVDLIPECTNISVGYQHEHTSFETLNVDYLEALITRLCAVDYSALPTCDWVDEDDVITWTSDIDAKSSTCPYCGWYLEDGLTCDCEDYLEGNWYSASSAKNA